MEVLLKQQKEILNLGIKTENYVSNFKSLFPNLKHSNDNSQNLTTAERVDEYLKRMDLIFQELINGANQLKEMNLQQEIKQKNLEDKIKNLENENFSVTIFVPNIHV